jgi:dTDP-glucose 4,6-dehydratase
MQNVLVTGGAGFIGSNFINFFLKAEKEAYVVNLDALTYSGNVQNLIHLSERDDYVFVEGNICDFELVLSLFKRFKIDTVIHFAAETHVDRSIANPRTFIETNVMGTYSLLEVARHVWLEEGKSNLASRRFHHISTDEVYGSLNPNDPPFTEKTPYQPNSPYAASKAASDHLALAYSHTYGLPITITNCSNNYGPYQYPEKLIPLMIINALNGKKLPIYGDGKNIRDWLYVEDHCEAICQVLKKGKAGETYIVGGNNQPTNLEVVETICKLIDQHLPKSKFVPHQSLIKFVPDRPGHDFRYAMDISKINGELGWQPKHSFELGLEKTVDWYLSNSEWVKVIQEKQGYQNWIGENYSARGGTK